MKTFEQWLESIYDNPVLNTAPPIPGSKLGKPVLNTAPPIPGSYAELGQMIQRLPPGIHLKDIIAANQEPRPQKTQTLAASRTLPQGRRSVAVPDTIKLLAKRIQDRYNSDQRVPPDNNVR